MSLADFGSFKIVLRNLIDKNIHDDLTKDEIDVQFSHLLKSIAKYFTEEKYFFLFDWIAEAVKREKELLYHKHFIDVTQKEKLENLQILIFKTHTIHSLIIEMIIDKIFVSNTKYIQFMNDDQFDLAVKVKISTLGFANSFLIFLTEKRNLDEKLFDKYIDLISKALNIFTI